MNLHIMIPQIKISDYNYNLPDERIAKYPLQTRDASKLLVYKNGIIDSRFKQLPEFLPEDAMMVFNETRVVPARLHFHRASGAHIEIFCLQPYNPADYVSNFAARHACSWRCIVGNVKKWKNAEELFLINPKDDAQLAKVDMRARLIEREGESSIVEFNWKSDMDFSEVLDLCGNIPIPPYLNRDTQDIDLVRYQTTYANLRGSVAAPTAGLHFTPEIMERISAKGIDIEKVCLHVGAGTFLPVKSEKIEGHVMHREPFVVSLDFLQKLLDLKISNKPLIAVGTTSVRTLESLYWAGVRCHKGQELSDICQWEPYEDNGPETEVTDALSALVAYMQDHKMKELSLGTKIIIVPGYKLRIVNILVTNFHQPQSTLLLLISAFIGNNWRAVYDHALENDYRFLSYGDSSLLFASEL